MTEPESYWVVDGPRVSRSRSLLLVLLAAVLVAVPVVGHAGRDDPARADDRAPAPAGSMEAGVGRPPTAPVEVTPMGASEPSRLVVDEIGVDVDVMDLGLAADGTLEAPPGAFPAGWYDGSPTPGELGPAVLAGHVSYDGTPGVFVDLAALSVGDEVEVEREDGSVAVFAVTESQEYAKDRFPTSTVYGDIDHAGLRLITCGGLDTVTGQYDSNVVVYAELTSAQDG